MALPPPFGSSETFLDRQTLEGVTLVILVFGVAGVVLGSGASFVLCYCICKKICRKANNNNKLPSCDCHVVLNPIFFVGFAMTAITWFIIIIVIAGIGIVGIISFISAMILCMIPCVIAGLLYLCYMKCKPGEENRPDSSGGENQSEPPGEQNPPDSSGEENPSEPSGVGGVYNRCKTKLKTKLSEVAKYTPALIKPLFSSVTMRFDSEKEVLLFAERKEPDDTTGKVWVHMYFLTTAVLALFWFLAVFIDNLWYRKVTTCNDVNVLSHNYICYRIDISGEVEDPVNCITNDGRTVDNPGEVLCYILLYSPGMALGIAVGVARFILFMTDLTFSTALWLGNHEWGRALLVSAQLLASVVSLAFVSVIPSVQVGAGKDISFLKWFLRGHIVGRVLVFALTTITIAVVPLVPWWAFKDKPKFKDICKKCD